MRTSGKLGEFTGTTEVRPREEYLRKGDEVNGGIMKRSALRHGQVPDLSEGVGKCGLEE